MNDLMNRLKPLRQRWQVYAKRIDAMSLRERVFLFLSAALVLAALLDSLLISPLNSEQAQLRLSQKKQAAELKALRDQFGEAARLNSADSPQGRLRSAIAAAQGEQQALDRELQQRSGLLDNSSQLPEVMGRLLRRHERLTLVKLNTLDDASSTTPAAAPAADNSKLKWRGVELRVAGDYLDLMRYLAELEKTLPTLRWGELRISSEQGQPLMQVQVFLVGGST
jgi:MSHA biogenesis protein MshJ